MVKQRKDRTGGEFIGFGAFAAASEQPAASPRPTVSSWSPVYTGSHSGFRSLFARLAQKSDSRTLTTALKDVTDLFQSNDLPKRQQIESLWHWAWLYHTKLGTSEANGTVRAASVQVWEVAYRRIPKAVASVCERYPELLGMLYSAKADPSSEVRNAIGTTTLLDQTEWDWQDGIMTYTTRILSYGRPSTMDEALFPKRTGEPDRDQMEERFDRLVGNCLDVLVLWMQQQQQHAPCTEPNDIWWKTFGSGKATLRRKTYQLAATVASSVPNSADGLRGYFPPALSSEKDANNMPTLLEALLTVLVKGTTPVDAPLIKSLVKVLKKACYQASVDQWGPMLLPMVAKMDTVEQQEQLLTAAQNGVETIVKDADKWRLWTAIGESAHVCGRTATTSATSTSFDDIWLHGLEFALQSDTFHRTARAPRTICLEALASQLVQKPIDQVPLGVMVTCPLPVLTDFVGALLKTTPKVSIPQLKQRFHTVVGDYQHHSGASPSKETYPFIVAALKYHGPDEMFETEALRTFIMNDLLRWAVLHTSSLSEQRNEDPHSVRFDFELLAQCLDDESRSNLWEPFLREMLAAKADVRQLCRGLEVLVAAREQDISPIQSESLDSFALDLATRSSCRSDEEFDADLEQSEVDFFRFCMKHRNGLSIVRAELIEKWVVAIPLDGVKTRSSSILEAMTEEIAIDFANRFQESLVLQVATAAWLVTMDDSTLARLEGVFNKSDELRSSFMEACASHLRSNIASADVGEELSWSKRCITLWKLCSKWDEILPPTGLECLSAWESNTEKMYQVLLALLREVKEPCDRMDIFRHIAAPTDSPDAFLSTILPLLSDAGPSILGSAKSRLRKDRAACLLDELFSSAMNRDDGLATAKRVIASMSETLTFQYVAVLSEILTVLLPPVSAPDPDEITIGEVSQYTKLWYILDEASPDIRVPATVVKVHHDAITGYYFTVRVDEKGGESREKQTLAGRLRISEGCSDDTKLLRISRQELRMLMLPVLSRHAGTTERSFGDFVSVLVTQIGLGKERGIGSVRFEVLKVISSLLDRSLAELSSKGILEGAGVMFQLALCLGFGFSVPQHLDNADLQCVSIAPITKAFVSIAPDIQRPGLSGDLLPWLVAILPLMTKDEAGIDADSSPICLQALFRQVTVMLSREQSPDSFLLACRAMLSGVKLITRIGDASVLDDLSFNDAFRTLLDVYFTPEKTIRETIKLTIDLIPEFDEILIALQHSKQLRSLWSKALRAKASTICQCLLHTNEHYRMYLMLNACAIDGVPLRDDENSMLSDGAKQILSAWIDGMGEEEAAEVEVDMDIVSKWLPEELMLRLENWDDEEDFTQIYSDRIIEGSFLWLSFLNFAQAAILTEYRVRPAFVSFLDRCGALNHALNLCVLYDGWVDSVDKEAVGNHIGFDRIAFLDPSQLVSSVIFQTMKLFPSLTRRWWEETCPKVYIQPIERFVENVVSPEILRRELEHIKSDSAFGEMTVSASLVSRQIIASYIQDECKLKVVITVPQCFPLRSAEVDCSQTLGVPEKRWKRWSLQIRQMLNSQGGTLRDALTLWKDNVDKEFEGVEPCPVCYSVLHVKTHKLPSLECSTCHNRFHFECLTQWFKSSGKNQCVLCQQQWRGTRV